MTAERQKELDERNAQICAYYTAGHSQSECESAFSLSRQRIQQILKKAGVWHPHERAPRSSRTKFLGVTVTEATKDALGEKAEQSGVSVSKLASDALDELVKE